MLINKLNFEKFAKMQGYNIQAEYKFIADRKFRADWFIILNDKKILIEYEGIQSAKARHTSVTGYSKDCQKYNLAQINGYIVLRYTVLNFNDVFNDLEKLK